MVMLASAGLLAIMAGMVCLGDAEFAWQLYQWDCRLTGMEPPRLRNWRLRVKQVGVALIVLGLVGFRVSLGM